MLLSFSAWSAGFNDNDNETITDFATGLTWQQSDAHNGSSVRSHSEAITYCDGLSLAGGGWRLPEVKELNSIVDRRRANPSIDLQYFPDAGILWYYWSASSYASQTSEAWVIDFHKGIVIQDNKTSSHYVRCVR